MAQLETGGVDRGVHPFLVQIRDEDTHHPLPGVIVGEIGPKMAMNSNDNGFLGFNHHRVPRSALLAKNSFVEGDGTYVNPPREKLGYATMVFCPCCHCFGHDYSPEKISHNCYKVSKWYVTQNSNLCR